MRHPSVKKRFNLKSQNLCKSSCHSQKYIKLTLVAKEVVYQLYSITIFEYENHKEQNDSCWIFSLYSVENIIT